MRNAGWVVIGFMTGVVMVAIHFAFVMWAGALR